MQQRCPGRVLVVDLGLTVWDIRSGYKDPFGLCLAGQDPGAARPRHGLTPVRTSRTVRTQLV